MHARRDIMGRRPRPFLPLLFFLIYARLSIGSWPRFVAILLVPLLRAFLRDRPTRSTAHFLLFVPLNLSVPRS